MTTNQYLDTVSKRFNSGISSEHSYRSDLEILIRSLVDDVEITNEPVKITNCGNPDYVITKRKIPIGYIEAKDIGKDLNSKSYKEQFNRYKKALDNLIITDYVWFQFFQNGDLVHEIKIAEITENGLQANAENFVKFENLIKDFCTHVTQSIKSSKKLAEMMAGKSRLLQDILERAITSDEQTQENTSLKGQFDTFKDILIHDLKPKGFADIYAQTLAYGMFAARLHDPTLNDFSRQEAAELIPKSNPFLRKLFGYIAGPDIDERIVTVVDNLAEVFRATNVEQLLQNFGKSTQTQDPIIHFYETFLAEYDPKLRKARGVWYTPEPVVNFIVRAVDHILKTDFNLPQGLADTSKTKIKVKAYTKATADKRSKLKEVEETREVHKVQILDPATGTGTFLAEVVKYIYNTNFKAMQGAWSSYVDKHLIPRLNGFELLMASYAMAHLKLDMLLTETGYKGTNNKRLQIYLTNSLEEHHKDTGTLFSSWLSAEANEANHIKRDTPVMCVIGNPPYSGESANKGKWIMDLMDDYKKEPGGKVKLKERNPKWINDDYVKFLRYGQHYIEKNGSGVLAFINPHGFLDNPTFRGMRWHLLKTYDKIYTIDLHGNSKKKEVSPDGSPDQNVFDIMQGVSINVFVKTGKKKPEALGSVFHYDLYGKRDAKYDFLWNNDLPTINFTKLPNKAPNYFMVQKDFDAEDKYNSGFVLNNLFQLNSLGSLTKRDSLSIDFETRLLNEKLKLFFDEERNIKTVCDYFGISIQDKDKWNAIKTRENLTFEKASAEITDILYRPFDNRKIVYNDYLVARKNTKVLSHFNSPNLGLILSRQPLSLGSDESVVCLISKSISDQNIYRRGGGTICPLYLYPENENQQTIEETQKRVPNLNKEIVGKISESLGLIFVADHEQEISPQGRNDSESFTPLDLLDYIYAVLHSPTYREKYKEFLKIDFPRVPYPKEATTFWQLVKLGSRLRNNHLLESPEVHNFITSYPKDGSNIITRKMTKTSNGFEISPQGRNDKNSEKDITGKVWINDEQYFDNVPLKAWDFYIGGYQPAQKWLKDRHERELTFEDILHYQKIIVALTETHNIMQEIDEIAIEK